MCHGSRASNSTHDLRRSEALLRRCSAGFRHAAQWFCQAVAGAGADTIEQDAPRGDEESNVVDAIVEPAAQTAA